MPTRAKPRIPLALNTALLQPGLRLAVGLSGGADSVALLRALDARSKELGLVLHAAHLHHGLRGAEADGDLEFCRDFSSTLNLPFHETQVDVASEALANPQNGKSAETLEEAARRVRYAWFRRLVASGQVDAVATAHTLDDQAETVLAKFLRGAWTEGLAGISPVLEFSEGRILRPLLGTTRIEIEAYLNSIGQSWREDSSNRHLTFTRNRIRHELLPLLESWNPKLREHLSQMATLAAAEEEWWEAVLARLAPQMILAGKPVRGGGRAAAAGLSIELTRFADLAPAMQRRLLRYSAEALGARLDFVGTEALRSLALTGRAGQRRELERLHAERTARELRLEAGPLQSGAGAVPVYSIAVPGEIVAPAFGLKIRIENTRSSDDREMPTAVLRTWAAGDRAQLRHSGTPRKVKEILERMRVTGSDRAIWPVLEIAGRIVWMKGVELEPEAGIKVRAETSDAIQGTNTDEA